MATHWIVIAGKSKTKFLMVSKKGAESKEVFSVINPSALLKEQDLVSDRPGRFSDGVSSQRSALDPQQSKMEHELHDYLREVADKVSASQRNYGFEKIDLIAEPGTLGPLRHAIARHKNLKISNEVHHDIVNLSEPEMLEKAREYLSIK